MREIAVPQQTMLEDIISFEHNQVNSFVKVLVGKGQTVNGKFEPFPSQSYEAITIINVPGLTNSMTGEVVKQEHMDYDELLSEHPAWAPTKPAGVFRKEDLWHFVDLIRARG